jgi:hypothetical protein
MRATGLDAFCAIVVLDGCPQIAVCKQVTRNPNLLRRCDSPRRRCSVAGVMGGNANADLKVYKRCFILQLRFAFKSCLVLKTVIAR